MENQPNITIINVKQMINSAIQQSSDGGTININKEDAEQMQHFLESIDDSVDLLKVKHAFTHGLKNAEKLALRYNEALIKEAQKFGFETTDLNAHNPWGALMTDEVIRMKPLHDDFVQLYLALIETGASVEFIHTCLEKLLQFSFDEFDCFTQSENWGFIKSDYKRAFIYSLFLYIVSYLLKEERFLELTYFLNSYYQVKCVKPDIGYGPEVNFNSYPFVFFNMQVKSVNDEYHRSKAGFMYWDNHKSLYADLIVRMHEGAPVVNIEDIVQSDLILFFISLFWRAKNLSQSWWVPHLSGYRKANTSELMLRCVSQKKCVTVLPMFNVTGLDEFLKLIPQVSQFRNVAAQQPFLYIPEADLALNYHRFNTQP
jgi:hypothetical protein